MRQGASAAAQLIAPCSDAAACAPLPRSSGRINTKGTAAFFPGVQVRGCQSPAARERPRGQAHHVNGRALVDPHPPCGGGGGSRAQLEDGSTYSTVHVEASVQVPAPGQGLWPAFWMMPAVQEYGNWPASGEVRAGARMRGCKCGASSRDSVLRPWVPG